MPLGVAEAWSVLAPSQEAPGRAGLGCALLESLAVGRAAERGKDGLEWSASSVAVFCPRFLVRRGDPVRGKSFPSRFFSPNWL